MVSKLLFQARQLFKAHDLVDLRKFALGFQLFFLQYKMFALVYDELPLFGVFGKKCIDRPKLADFHGRFGEYGRLV